MKCTNNDEDDDRDDDDYDEHDDDDNDNDLTKIMTTMLQGMMKMNPPISCVLLYTMYSYDENCNSKKRN